MTHGGSAGARRGTLTVGIDFGESFARIASATRSVHGDAATEPARVRYIHDAFGRERFSTTVRVTPDRLLLLDEDIGAPCARAPATTGAGEPVAELRILLLLGRAFRDEIVQREITRATASNDALRSAFYAGADGKTLVMVGKASNARIYTVEEIVSDLLRRLVEIVEPDVEETTIENIVVAVPEWTHEMSQAIRNAAKRAQLRAMLVRRSTCVTQAYDLHRKETLGVLVVEVSTSGMTLKLLETAAGVTEVAARAASVALSADAVKQWLCRDATGHLKSLSLDPARVGDFWTEHAPQMRSILAELFERQRYSRLHRADINFIAVVSYDVEASDTRAHFLGQRLVPLFQNELPHAEVLTEIAPPLVAVHGAALIAATTYVGDQDMFICFARPVHSFGIEVCGGVMLTVLERTQYLTHTKTVWFRSVAANQSHVHLRVLEGDEVLARDNDLLAVLVLNGLPPSDVLTIKVTITLTEYGVLTVEAEEVVSHKRATVTITDIELQGPERQRARRKEHAEAAALAQLREYVLYVHELTHSTSALPGTQSDIESTSTAVVEKKLWMHTHQLLQSMRPLSISNARAASVSAYTALLNVIAETERWLLMANESGVSTVDGQGVELHLRNLVSGVRTAYGDVYLCTYVEEGRAQRCFGTASDESRADNAQM